MTADDVAKILDELGQRLGPAGSRVFELAVRQQIIEGLYWLAGLVVLFVIACILTYVMRRWFAEENVKHPVGDNEHLGWDWRIGLYGLAWSFFLVTLLTVGGGVVSRLLNPEYQALRDILSQIRR